MYCGHWQGHLRALPCAPRDREHCGPPRGVLVEPSQPRVDQRGPKPGAVVGQGVNVGSAEQPAPGHERPDEPPQRVNLRA